VTLLLQVGNSFPLSNNPRLRRSSYFTKPLNLPLAKPPLLLATTARQGEEGKTAFERNIWLCSWQEERGERRVNKYTSYRATGEYMENNKNSEKKTEFTGSMAIWSTVREPITKSHTLKAQWSLYVPPV